MDNQQTSRDLIERVWNKRDFKAFADFLTPDFVAHDPLAQDQYGPESQVQFAQGMTGAFPDVRAKITGQETEGDIVITHVEFSGHHTGTLYTPEREYVPTNKAVTVEVTVSDRYNIDGYIVESWAEWSPEDMFRQLGIG